MTVIGSGPEGCRCLMQSFLAVTILQGSKDLIHCSGSENSQVENSLSIPLHDLVVFFFWGGGGDVNFGKIPSKFHLEPNFQFKPTSN